MVGRPTSVQGRAEHTAGIAAVTVSVGDLANRLYRALVSE